MKKKKYYKLESDEAVLLNTFNNIEEKKKFLHQLLKNRNEFRTTHVYLQNNRGSHIILHSFLLICKQDSENGTTKRLIRNSCVI